MRTSSHEKGTMAEIGRTHGNIGRAPGAAMPQARRTSPWAYPALVVLIIAVVAVLIAQWNVYIILLGVGSVAIGALSTRAGAGTPKPGTIDAAVSPGVITSFSDRRPAWFALATLVAGLGTGAIWIVGLLATPGGVAGNYAFFVLPIVFAVGYGVVYFWRALQSRDVRIDTAGLVLSAPIGGSTSVPWSTILITHPAETFLTYLDETGAIHAVPLRTQRTDPYILTEIITRCVDDPSARPRLGDPLLQDLLAERKLG